ARPRRRHRGRRRRLRGARRGGAARRQHRRPRRSSPRDDGRRRRPRLARGSRGRGDGGGERGLPRLRRGSGQALLVAIDGPAGAGKSTVARAVADELGFTYLDSGAMYRCVALLSLASPELEPAVLASAANIELADAATPAGATRTILDGRDVTEQIRAPVVSEAASAIAGDPGVRAAL